MTLTHSLYHYYQRYRTLQTHRITALPIAILMPHSACNCRCVMCDIWKGNRNLKELTEADITGLMSSFRKLGTRQVLMSGGEALLNPSFFRFCEILRQHQIEVTLLSTGITLARHAAQVSKYVREVIVSLDGGPETHDRIRNIPGAFAKLEEGVKALRSHSPHFRVTARTVIHRLNFHKWPEIVRTTKYLELQRISFLPADVSSQAFNRATPWTAERQEEILPAESELPALASVLQQVLTAYQPEIGSGFIAESALRLQQIYAYYAAFYGLNPFPYKKCNAPWVSAVIEADGTVRPCFFHEPMGNIRKQPFDEILNSPQAIQFRKGLDMDQDPTCKKCVCHLHLAPRTRLN